nr:hypothetical protein [Tanacetum cinerariifolium]
RKNRTLIEAARSMLADYKLPTMFWTEAVSTACYVLNRVLITNPHIKTPYELLSGKVPNISHLKPFGCQVTILNTSDHLGKFEGKAIEGFFVGYATHSKAYRVYNLFSKKVEEILNLRYLEDKPNVQSLGQEWYFNLDYLTDSLGYTRFKSNIPAAAKYGFEFSNKTAEMLHQAEIKTRRNLVLDAGDPAGSIVSTGGIPAGSVPTGSVPAGSVPASSVPAGGVLAGSVNSAGFGDPAISESIPAVFNPDHADNSTLPPGHSLGSSEHSIRFPSPFDLGNHQPTAGIFSSSSYDDDFCADVTNLASSVAVDPVATKKVNTIHPQSQILRELHVAKALEDPDWVAAMQEEMQQFFNQQLWKLVPLPDGKIAIGTKWILKNKRDAKGIVVRNKARLVAQGHWQEEGIDYDELFAPVARIKAIRLFLAFASYMGFMVYQMDMKSSFLYGEIKEEVYVTQPKGFEDPHNPKHVYRVVKALYGLHQEPRAWFMWMTSSLVPRITPSVMSLSQDKYVRDMLKKFDMKSMRTATTSYEVPKPKSKDEPNDAVNTLGHTNDFPLKCSYEDIQVSQRKSTTGGCQFLGRRLISWHCKKQTIMATSSTEAEYVASASCYGQSTICIVKNLVFHQRTKHIEIRHHFIRDANEKNLIQVFLLVVLVYADGLVSAGSCIIPTGSYSFMLLDWFLLVVMSYIQYALTHHPPIVFDSLVKQFWATATVRTLEAGPSEIIAIIDGNEVVVTESLIRTQLQLNDKTWMYEFTLHDVLNGMRETVTYNFSRFILDGMIGNIGSKRHKFFIYPRFLQMILVVPAAGDGADAAAAGAAAANKVPPPPPPPAEPTPVQEPTPSPMRELTTFREPTPEPSSPPPFIEDISEDGGGYVSLPKSNEAPPTTTSTTARGAEDSVALTNLSLKLDSTSLGCDTTVEATYTIYKASQDAHASSDVGPDEDEVPDTINMPFRRTRTKRRRLRKTFTSSAFKHFQENNSAVEDTISVGAGIPADAQTIPAGSTPIPTTGGKAPMVDDSIPADLLTEQEREAEFARQQEDLAQKAQAESVASPAAQGIGLSAQRRRELDAA